MKSTSSTFTSDTGKSPIERIFRENPVFENENLFVVKDIDPISDSHYLVMAKGNAPSMVDFFKTSLHDFDIKLIAERLGIKSWMILERGRAPFCTSMLTANHAHAHLFDSFDFSSNVKNEFASFCDRSHQSLAKAFFDLSANQDQYILMGDDRGVWQSATYPSPIFERKRAIREFLSARKVGKR